MRKILIVCSGNICRSPMAEGILRAEAGKAGLHDVEIRSAGTLGIVENPPAENAIDCCRERGIDIGALRSTALKAELLEWADIVLGMEADHLATCRAWATGVPPRLVLLGTYGRPEEPEIEDPVGQDLEAFRDCRDLLFTCVEQFVRQELLPRRRPGGPFAPG